MFRKIITIHQEKCNGCGICAQACHEGAIGIVDGKAKLLREDFCDGFGDCLPACPTGAIAFEEREVPAYNEAAVKAAKKLSAASERPCPGSAAKSLHRHGVDTEEATSISRLSQWPVQIKLVSVNAAYFNGAKLLAAADCTAYAYGNFHNAFMKDSVTIIGCPKLDMVDYTEKLTRLIAENDIKSVTVVRMEVPCCGGLENAVKHALKNSGKVLPWKVATISIDGRILE